MLHTISEALSVIYPSLYIVTSVQETLRFHFHCEGMAEASGNSDPAAVMAAGSSRGWARNTNHEDLKMLPHLCREAFGRLERWLLHLESEAQAHCARRLQAAMQEARSTKAKSFSFSLGLTPKSYSPSVMQAILAPSSKCSSKAAALEAHRYQVCVGKQTGQGFARHSKGLHSSDGGAPGVPAPPMPVVSIQSNTTTSAAKVRPRGEVHSPQRVSNTITSIIHHLRYPGNNLLVPRRDHADCTDCPDLFLEVFQQALLQPDAAYLALHTALPPRNPAHALLTYMSPSALKELMVLISGAKDYWSCHPILCAMQRLWVKMATPPWSWQTLDARTSTVLLTLDLGFQCKSNPFGFPRYHEIIHAAVAANPDISNACISGSSTLLVTVDLRKLLCDMLVEDWANGVSTIVEGLSERAGCIRGLVDHIIQQGIMDSIADWRTCLGCSFCCLSALMLGV